MPCYKLQLKPLFVNKYFKIKGPAMSKLENLIMKRAIRVSELRDSEADIISYLKHMKYPRLSLVGDAKDTEPLSIVGYGSDLDSTVTSHMREELSPWLNVESYTAIKDLEITAVRDTPVMSLSALQELENEVEVLRGSLDGLCDPTEYNKSIWRIGRLQDVIAIQYEARKLREEIQENVAVKQFLSDFVKEFK